MGRKLGQHFLKNQHALDVMVNALQITKGDTIIEIGPGHGELTGRLLASPANHIIAIEKDPMLAETLESRMKNYALGKRLTIITGDACTELPAIHLPFTTHHSKLAGNIPYYITGYLFRTIGELRSKPSCAAFMVQKEVAERVCETPPRMNRLAASVQIWAEPKIIMILAPKDFEPAPKVDSAIIFLGVRKGGLGFEELGSRKLGAYYRMVNILFRQPRKTIINNLSFSLPYISKEKLLGMLADTDTTPTARPHNLSIEKIQELSTKLLG